MAAGESDLILLIGVTRVRLRASPFVRVCSQIFMNSYDESAGAIGMPQNATSNMGGEMSTKPAQQIFSNSETASQWVVKKDQSWMSEKSSCVIMFLVHMNNLANWTIIRTGPQKESIFNKFLRNPRSTLVLRDMVTHSLSRWSRLHWLLIEETWMCAQLERLI